MRVISSRRSRHTGTVVSVVDNRDDGFECSDKPWTPPEGCTWATVCEDHSTYVMHASRKLAVYFAPYPDEFCEGCQDLIAERAKL